MSVNAAVCHSRCQACGVMFIYQTTRRALRALCDACRGTKPAAPKDEPFVAATSTREFILAWDMSDSMDDLLMLLPEYNDPADNGKGRGRARNRAHLLRKDGHDLKMMPKS